MRLLIVKRDEYVRVKKMISEKLIEKIKLSKEKKVKDGSRDSFEQLRNAVK